MAKNKKAELHVVKNEKEETSQSKPTPEETQQFKADFDEGMKQFAETRWPISEPGNAAANEIYFFLLEYMKKYAAWEKTQWMGIIKMDEELKKYMQEVNDTQGLALDYQALEFCGFMLYNPKGTGLISAIEFEKIADQYSKLMMTVGQQVEKAREQLKHVQYLQEKWAAAEQGFYLAELEPKKEQPSEGNTGTPPTEEFKDRLDDLKSDSKIVNMDVKKDVPSN